VVLTDFLMSESKLPEWGQCFLENPVLGSTHFLGFESTGWLSTRQVHAVYTGKWGGKYEFHRVDNVGRVFKYTSRPEDPLQWYSDGEDEPSYSAVFRRTSEEITDNGEKQRVYNLIARLNAPIEAGLI
jgi:hypothetical protein